MTRIEEARERVMEALDAWYEQRGQGFVQLPYEEDLIDAYAAYKRAENGEPEE